MLLSDINLLKCLNISSSGLHRDSDWNYVHTNTLLIAVQGAAVRSSILTLEILLLLKCGECNRAIVSEVSEA
jgi:hypothetical protein